MMWGDILAYCNRVHGNKRLRSTVSINKSVCIMHYTNTMLWIFLSLQPLLTLYQRLSLDKSVCAQQSWVRFYLRQMAHHKRFMYYKHEIQWFNFYLVYQFYFNTFIKFQTVTGMLERFFFLMINKIPTQNSDIKF